MRLAGRVARIGERRIKFFGEKPEGQRPLERSRLRWEDNIRRNLIEI